MIESLARFFSITILSIGLSLSSLWGMRQIGSMQNVTDTYLDPQDCPLPCWRGIQPGTQNDEAFLRELERTNRYDGFVKHGSDQVSISVMRLNMWGDVTVGDVFLAFGEPSHVSLRYTATTGYSGVQRRQLIGAWLYFGEGLVRVEAIREDDVRRLSPDMIVQRIQYYAPSPEGSVIPIGTPKWHGFTADY